MISQKAQQLKDQMRQERRKDSLDSGALQYPIPSADLLDGLDFEVTQLQDCQITTIFSPSSRQGVILFLQVVLISAVLVGCTGALQPN